MRVSVTERILACVAASHYDYEVKWRTDDRHVRVTSVTYLNFKGIIIIPNAGFCSHIFCAMKILAETIPVVHVVFVFSKSISGSC